MKATGNGHREGGIGAIDFYTEWKAVYVDYSDKLQKAQIDRAGVTMDGAPIRSLCVIEGTELL